MDNTGKNNVGQGIDIYLSPELIKVLEEKK